MPVEKAGVGALAHGVQSQQQIPQHLLRVEGVRCVVGLVGVMNDFVQVGENGVILRTHPCKIGAVRDPPFLIELFYHQLQCVDAGRVKALVDAEDIPQEGDVLCQQRSVKRCRRVRIVRLAAIVPAAGFQEVDAVLPTEVVEKTAAQPSALILHLMLGVQRDDAFTSLPHIAQ